MAKWAVLSWCIMTTRYQPNSNSLVRAREAGRRHITGDLLVYLDADPRLPLGWLEMVERAFRVRPDLVGLSGAFRFYDWDPWGRFLAWLYDSTVAPLTHGLWHHVLSHTDLPATRLHLGPPLPPAAAAARC